MTAAAGIPAGCDREDFLVRIINDPDGAVTRWADTPYLEAFYWGMFSAVR